MLEWIMLGAGIIDNLLDKKICGNCKKEGVSSVSIQDVLDSLPHEMKHYIDSEYLVTQIMGVALSSNDLDRAFGRKSPTPNTRSEILNSNRICKSCYDKNFTKVEEKFNRDYMGMNTVKTFPSTYTKPIEISSSIKPKIVTYSMNNDKWGTLNKMKFQAYSEGYNLIYNISYNYSTGKITAVFAKQK